MLLETNMATIQPNYITIISNKHEDVVSHSLVLTLTSCKPVKETPLKRH